MFSVYQHWDPLDVCLVGKSYPPEFYSWIKNVSTRSRFEQLAIETEEDFQQLISLLEKFNVKIHRPDFPENLEDLFVENKWVQPPVTPRDYFLMIHDRFWVPRIPNKSHAWNAFYRKIKLNQRPDDFCCSTDFIYHADVKDDFAEFNRVDQKILDTKLLFYSSVFDTVRFQSNQIVYTDLDFVNGCFVTRIGQNLFFATQTYHDNQTQILDQVNELFPDTTNRVVDAGGHGDSTYCPITPGLIISLKDVSTYQNTFPGWEVVYLEPSQYAHITKFKQSMKLNMGRWFLPDFDKDQNLINIVNYYFDEWIGQVSETVFDVNILVIDPRNVVVSSYNRIVALACRKYNIEMHVVPFRHRYFWDAGIHCVTNDLNRIGIKQTFL